MKKQWKHRWLLCVIYIYIARIKIYNLFDTAAEKPNIEVLLSQYVLRWLGQAQIMTVGSFSTQIS